MPYRRFQRSNYLIKLIIAKNILHCLLFQLLSNVLFFTSLLLQFLNDANSAGATGEAEVPNAVRGWQDGAGTAPCHPALRGRSSTGNVAVNGREAFLWFQLWFRSGHCSCFASTHLQHEIALIFHLVKPFLC